MAFADQEAGRLFENARRLWLEHNEALREGDHGRMRTYYDEVIDLLSRLLVNGHIGLVVRFIHDPALRVPVRAFCRKLGIK